MKFLTSSTDLLFIAMRIQITSISKIAAVPLTGCRCRTRDVLDVYSNSFEAAPDEFSHQANLCVAIE